MSEEQTHAEKLEEALQDEVRRAWHALLDGPAGRLIAWSIMDRCGMNNFTLHDTPTMDALMKGRQQIGAEILEEFVFSAGMRVYTDMMLEADQRQQRLENALQQDERELEDDSE